MKYKRQKKLKSILRAYKQLGYETPFKLVLDGTFTMAALQNKVNLSVQIASYFGVPECSPDALQLCTTKCVLKELEKLGSYFYGALHILKQFTVVQCAHPRKKLKPAVVCLSRMTEGGEKYIFASQDKTLQEVVEKKQMPLLYLHSATLVLKKPTFVDSQREMHKVDLDSEELKSLQSLKSKEGLPDGQPLNPLFEKRREKLLKKLERKKKEKLLAKKKQKLSVNNEIKSKAEDEQPKSRSRKRKSRHLVKKLTASKSTSNFQTET